MPGSVIVSAARTPIGKQAGSARRLHRHGPRRASPSRRRSNGPASAVTQVDYVIMGQVLQAGQGQITARQAAVKGGVPMTVPGHDAQQGLPVGHQRPLRRRPDDQRRRRRGRDRRRDGVDDQGSLPAARRPGRLPDGQRRADRLDDPRRAVVRLRRRAHGVGHREVQRPVLDQPPGSRTSSPPRATSGPPPPSRTGASPTRSPRSRCPSARATRSSSRTTRASGRGRRPRASAPSAPPSPRTARSPPATPRRSPTAAPP